jgi:succinyl-diaminopimelate desuccinylase
VVPGLPGQFEPRVEGDRLIGRGAYDMKGGLAAMMCALRDVGGKEDVCVRLVCVPDEESEELDVRATQMVVNKGIRGDFAITGEPTNLRIGVEAKGVLVMRIDVRGRSAHSSTPWLGDNAILKALDVFRAIESLPFARASSEVFDRPSINLGRISGGDALNKVPDRCQMAVDVRFLPEQDPGEILAQVRGIPDVEVTRTFIWPPATVPRNHPYVRALAEAVSRSIEGEVLSVGRDGASDATAFLSAGIPSVEFGPDGGGHHGPDEWVSIASLARCRRALGDFVRALPVTLEQQRPERGLTAIDGGRRAGESAGPATEGGLA